jgi:hypothetical protein
MSEAEGKPAPKKKLWRVVPYLVAAGAIAAILYRYRPQDIAAEMGRGNFLGILPIAFVLVATGVLPIAASDWVILHGVLPGPTFWQVCRARVGISLLLMLGYGAGIGGAGVWIARVTGCGARLATGIMLYNMSADLIAVSAIAAGSIWIGGAEVSPGLRYAAPAIAAVLLGLKMIGPIGSEERAPQVLLPWRRIGRGRALLAVLLRFTNLLWITVACWAGANAFGMPVPLGAMTTYFPIVLVVGSMPVNIGGFGAVQGAWLLLAPWAESAEQVLAFSVLWQLTCAGFMALRGLPFLSALSREIEQGREIEQDGPAPTSPS